MTDQPAAEPFRSWAVVEIFGHERIAGEVSEQAIAGTNMLRVEVPGVGGQPGFTRFYGHGAIYSIQPVSEDVARRAAGAMRVRPVNVYLLPAGSGEPGDDDANGEQDEDDHSDDDFDDDSGDEDHGLGEQGDVTDGSTNDTIPF